MYYDKATDTLNRHELDRNPVNAAALLRFMATNIENNTLGALSLNMLGDIFGNEFWNLIYPAPPSVIRVECVHVSR